jgi:DNA-binding PadR family transcriptional regulator
MLDFAILGILTDGPLHGYELKRRLADSDHGFWTVSFGSLYPALRRLERRDFIAVAAGSSRRKVYQLTPEGKAYFQEVLEDPDAALEERDFNLKLSFFRHLDPESRLGLLEGRKAHLKQRLAEARRSASESAKRTRRRLDAYTDALIRRSERRVEADIDWLDELIEYERSQDQNQKGKQ